MEIETRAAETAGPAWTDRVTALPVYAVVGLTLSFIWFQGFVNVSYENQALTLLLNTLVVAGVSAWVAALALRGYLASGLPEMLYAGCGLVAMGASFLLSSLFVGGAQGPNHAVAVQNLGVFCASIFHLAAALHVGQPRVDKPDPTAVKAACPPLGVLALTGFFWAAAQYDLAPAFFIPGKGTTPARQLVLTVSVAMLTVAAAFLIRNATRRGSLSLRCYGLGLGLIAMGFVDVSIAVPGSILSWTGRLSISLGHLYLLSAFMVANRQGILFETSHRRKDGSTFPVEVSSQGATTDGTRTLVSVVCDITEREKAEKASRESEARFRLLANTAEQLLTTGDPQALVRDLAARVMAHLDCHCFFNFLVADEAAARLRLNAWAGISEEEARRIEWLDYGVAVCGCVAREGRRIVAEHIAITPDVRTELVKSYGVKAYACHPLIGVDGRVLGTLSFGTRSRDTFSADDLALMKAVTDLVAVAMVRIQNEQALRRSEEALRKANEELGEPVRERTLEREDTVAALRNEIVVRKKIQTQLHQLSRVFMDAADPIIIEDLSGMVVEMNREAEAVYGWSREELIGKPVNTLFPPERQYLAAQLRERCGAGQEIRNWEGIRKARSGRVIPSLLTAFPLTDESGKVAFVATICKDISERQEMEARLKDAQRHLQALSRKSLEALEADRRSVARELHDSIGGSLAAIKFALEDAAEQAAKIPSGGAASLDTIVSHLADTIKETKRISANLRPLMLDDLGLLATIDWYTQQFRQRYGDIRLVRQFEVEEHEIPEDFKIVVYRVMQEAVTNAARHSRADTICIRLRRNVTRFEFEVEDNGCGFDLNEVFDRKDQLTGFGLRSMQERAEICGGVINIYTQPGNGTCVRVTRSVETNPTGCATG